MAGNTYIDPIKDSLKKSITPAMPGAKSREKDLSRAARAESATSDLRDLESNAAAPTAELGDSVSGARAGEENVGSLFTGKGKSSKGKFNGKKATGFIGIILAIFGGGAALFGSQGFQAFSLVNNLMSNFSSSSYSSNARLFTTLRSAIKGTSKIKSTSELSDALESSGVKVNADADGNIESLTKISTGETYGASNIDTALDGNLKSNVSKASEVIDIDSTYTSKAKTYAAKRIDWDKNRYAEYDDGSTKTATDVDNFEDIAYGKNKSTAIDGAEIVEKKEEVEVDDGKGGKTTETITYEEPETTITDTVKTGKDVDIEATKAQLDNIANKVNSAANFSQATSGTVCASSSIATAISAVSIGMQMMSMINFSSGYLESVQKIQAGIGNGASFAKYQNATNSGKFWSSKSIRAIFGDNSVGSQSAGVANLENVVSNDTALSLGNSKGAWKSCIGGTMTGSVLGIIGVFTGGIGTIMQVAFSVVIAGVTGVVIQSVVKTIVDKAVDAIAVDPVADMGSEDAAEYTTSGTNIILSAIARSSSLSAGTETKVAEFEAYKDSVIASRADYDREALSPFDITNKNTFLGSLAYSLISFSVLNSSKTTTNLIKSTSTIVNNSLVALLPTASAIHYNNVLDYTSENCPLVNSVGATGSSLHCNYASIADVDSFNITYDEAVSYLCKTNNLENCDSTPTVVSGSELAKYIEFWTTRDSHLGLADSGITAALTLTSNSSAIDGAIGAVPLIGDAIDFINKGIEAANEDYIFGSAYVAGGEFWNSHPDMKYIQAYLELDTLYSDLAFIETPTLAAYLDDYYEKNPIDESYEGTLARFSGLEKEEVIAVLDYMNYMDYIANYDPSTRYNFVTESSYDSASDKVATLAPSKLNLIETKKISENLPANETNYAKIVSWKVENRAEFSSALS